MTHSYVEPELKSDALKFDAPKFDAPKFDAPKFDRSRAGDVVAAYVAEQHRTILAGDLALRRGEDGVIHTTRVATRRLRSVLRIFAALFDSDRAQELDRQLRWYAGLLGEVRDCQVLRTRLNTMIDALDSTLLLGPVRARVDAELRRAQAEAWQRLQTALSSADYVHFLSDLASWVRDPSSTPRARERAKVLRHDVARANRAVTARLRRANATGDVAHLHRARKASKRARYAAECAEPVLGSRAAGKQARRYQKLQDLLGEHQDSLVSAALLRRLGAVAGVSDGENGFAFGILYEREVSTALRVRKQARQQAHRYA